MHENLLVSEHFDLHDVELYVSEISKVESNKDWISIGCVLDNSCVVERNQFAVHILMSFEPLWVIIKVNVFEQREFTTMVDPNAQLFLTY